MSGRPKRHSHKWIINNLDKVEVIEMDFRKLENYITDKEVQISILVKRIENLEDAIKQRYAILKEQNICVDCFKDVPQLASLCIDSTKKEIPSEIKKMLALFDEK